MQQAWTSDRHTFEMKVKLGRQSWKDAMSEFCTGTLTVNAEGLTISGKAVPSNASRGTMFALFGVLGHLIMEHAMRRDRTDIVAWHQVDAVLVESAKNRVCLVYHVADKPKAKTALGLVMEGGNMENFLRSVRAVAPEKVVEGKVGAETNIWVLLVVVVVVILLIVLSRLGSPTP